MQGIKYNLKRNSSLLLLCLSWQVAFGQAPRLILEGVGGTGNLGQVDLLLPLSNTPYSLFYTDWQGKYQLDNTENFLGLGLGYRQQRYNAILGGYLFLDYNESEHSHHYWVLSPGIEKLTTYYDFHLNAYVPLKDRHDEEHFFLSGLNSCGINGDCQFVEFHSHQQFEHQFVRFEEVGYGLDIAVGTRFLNSLPNCLQCIALKGGAYYYHLHDSSDIVGAAARLEIPVNPRVGVLLEAGYNNNTHGAIVLGLKYQFGHQVNGCGSLCDRFYDPAYRNLATFDRGTSIPVERNQKDEGLSLRRDNIFFFSERGTGIIGDPNAGTFEDPFRNDQFTQVTVNDIGPNANLYFNTGTYAINFGTPTNSITLMDEQSIFGRTPDFRCSAVGLQRPILDGGFNLVSTHNTLDSIQLVNEATAAASANQTLTALSLTETTITLCNNVIEAIANKAGNNNGTNVALGIVANGSDVFIKGSQIEAQALVVGNNEADAVTSGSGAIAINVASGIGNYNGNFNENKFVIIASSIIGSAQVGGNNMATAGPGDSFSATAINQATGIGNNTNSIAFAINTTETSNLASNIFTLNGSDINSLAQVVGNNTANALDLGFSSAAVFNQAASIGNNLNAFASSPGSLTSNSASNTTDNTFALSNSVIFSLAHVGGDNVANASPAGALSAAAFNQATSIGDCAAAYSSSGGMGTVNSTSTSNITNNTFIINCLDLSNHAQVAGNNMANATGPLSPAAVFNQTSCIGGNAAAFTFGAEGFAANPTSSATLNFIENTFTLSSSELISQAQVANNVANAYQGMCASLAVNQTIGVGNNIVAFAYDTAVGKTSISTSISNSNFTDNTFNIVGSDINALAQITANNEANASAPFSSAGVLNQAAGIGDNVGTFGFNYGQVTSLRSSSTANFNDNAFSLSHSEINSLAHVVADNLANATNTNTAAAAFNRAVGIGNDDVAYVLNGAINASAASSSISNFTDNTFSLSYSKISNFARVAGNSLANPLNSSSAAAFNQAVVIGGNVAAYSFSGESSGGTVSSISTTNFNDNTFTLSHLDINSFVQIGSNSQATVTDDSLAAVFNQATGIGNNTAAFGAGATAIAPSLANTFEISQSVINAIATIGGNNDGQNQVFAINANDMGQPGSKLNINASIINIFTQIVGNNTSSNQAMGLRAVTNSWITATDCVVNVTALANGLNSPIGKEGNVIALNTIFKIKNKP